VFGRPEADGKRDVLEGLMISGRSWWCVRAVLVPSSAAAVQYRLTSLALSTYLISPCLSASYCEAEISLSSPIPFPRGSEGAAQLIVDVHPDDLIERALGGEAQPHRARRL
jgi:hypothetical protein